jgi:hypothetical protein
MLRRLILPALVLGCLAATATTAQAASPHFKKNGEPTCTIGGTGTPSRSTTCTASLAGLSNQDLLINVTTSGSAVYQCQNPSGQNEPRGQNQVLVGPVTTPTNIDSDAIKNGNVTFTTNPAVLSAPTTVPGTQAGCNNDSWTGVNPLLTITTITMTIAQGGVTHFTCTASNPAGLAGTVALAC